MSNQPRWRKLAVPSTSGSKLMNSLINSSKRLRQGFTPTSHPHSCPLHKVKSVESSIGT